MNKQKIEQFIINIFMEFIIAYWKWLAAGVLFICIKDAMKTLFS
jgi:hypothetical protein